MMPSDDCMPSLNGETWLVGLLGWPVAHSMSPTMHNAALRGLGLNGCYVPLPVRPHQVEQAVHGLVALGFHGANVTVPHKQAVIPLLDEITPEAQSLGAVNTICIERDDAGGVLLRGSNTDVPGFLGDLRAHGFEPRDARVVVVGAGGAARGVVYALLQAGADEVLILNRTPARAEALAADLASDRQVDLGVSRLIPGPLNARRLSAAAQEADLLVNATTVGMWPEVAASIWPEDRPVPSHLIVYDLVYNPLETRLLRQARRAGARGIDGLGMLARQGALSLDAWVSAELAVEDVVARMRHVCERAFETRSARPL